MLAGPGKISCAIICARLSITNAFYHSIYAPLATSSDNLLRLPAAYGIQLRTVNWYIEGLRKYAVFRGRARRREYWMFDLINSLVSVALFVIAVLIGKAGFGYLIGLPFLYALATVIPSFAKLIRRLHDTNHSGWWFFIAMIPVVGPLILLRLLVADSDPGENRFGPNPKAVPALPAVPGMGYLAPPLPHDRP